VRNLGGPVRAALLFTPAQWHIPPRTRVVTRASSGFAATAAELRPGKTLSDAVECLTKDRDALLTFYDFPAEPPAISGGAGLEHPWCAAAAGNDA